MSGSKGRVESVERALSILNAFSERETSLTLKRLSDKTGLYKSTILRLLGTLEHHGFILKRDNGEYCLGSSLWRLGTVYKNSFDSEKFIRPILASIRDQINETVAFYIKSGDSRICLYRENANREVCHHLNEGAQLPLDRGAAGRVLMAFSGAEGGLFESIRKTGFYWSKGERNPDVCALAVPVISPSGDFKGVLSVSALIFRMDQSTVDELLPMLKTEAERAGRAIEGSPLM